MNENRKNRYLPGWIKNIKEKDVREAVASINQEVWLIQAKRREYQKYQVETKALEIDIAKDDLKDILANGYSEEENNPLLVAVNNVIKEKVVWGSLQPFYIKELCPLLRDLEYEEKKKGNMERGIFFENLAFMIEDESVAPYLVPIVGGVLVEKTSNGSNANHYFAGIAISLRKQVGVKGNTRPENRILIQKAYEIMRDSAAEGAARRGVEAQIEDLKKIYADMEKAEKQKQKAKAS